MHYDLHHSVMVLLYLYSVIIAIHGYETKIFYMDHGIKFARILIIDNTQTEDSFIYRQYYYTVAQCHINQ